ncbi:MAG: UDP-2,4-diacetamido-2,4,6-trideoxy-beta-L-altropyranose hydrolase [Burkholderiaceae bacterium]|nr:UDP-2,4-diacetamido-2,4,6-trideoxy-beta-L-altropyranose hydrolase [Burkholderiaceae bacterium]
MASKFAFRTDASVQIGTGHVMRCLTLADALVAKGAECEFICRAHDGNLIEFIRGKGYVAHALATDPLTSANTTAASPQGGVPELTHHKWLGATQAQDAEACASILAALRPDWLIVDHYAIDARWERALAAHYRNLMVIDDLADRTHTCHLLLDQTYGREASDYHSLVPAHCRVLCGSHYALLRPEFAALRPYSLERRTRPALRELLITMGGVDKDNVTGRILEALRTCPLPADCRVTVVMGSTAPWQDEVRKQAQDMPWPTRVLVGVPDMAQLMADSDLAIGAAGATSWERCCLGLPTAIIVVAENQRYAADLLGKTGAVETIFLGATLVKSLSEIVLSSVKYRDYLKNLANRAAEITDGRGAGYISNLLLDIFPDIISNEST